MTIFYVKLSTQGLSVEKCLDTFSCFIFYDTVLFALQVTKRDKWNGVASYT